MEFLIYTWKVARAVRKGYFQAAFYNFDIFSCLSSDCDLKLGQLSQFTAVQQRALAMTDVAEMFVTGAQEALRRRFPFAQLAVVSQLLSLSSPLNPGPIGMLAKSQYCDSEFGFWKWQPYKNLEFRKWQHTIYLGFWKCQHTINLGFWKWQHTIYLGFWKCQHTISVVFWKWQHTIYLAFWKLQHTINLWFWKWQPYKKILMTQTWDIEHFPIFKYYIMGT